MRQQFVSVKEASAILGYSAQTVRKYAEEGGCAYKHGHSIRIELEELIKYFKESSTLAKKEV